MRIMHGRSEKAGLVRTHTYVRDKLVRSGQTNVGYVELWSGKG